MTAGVPASVGELVDEVARSSPAPLVVAGAGTKRPAGASDAARLTLTALTGIVYIPTHFVLRETCAPAI